MMENPLKQLATFGQSIWLDQMRRSLLTSGELKRMVDVDGLCGVTSNPTIFENAIAGSADYERDIRGLAARKASVEEIYERLVIGDIVAACDVMRPVYDRSGGRDGFVSLEVSPLLAHDTEATIAEAKALFARIDRPNALIKVPATPEGIPAFETLIAAGINVNVTLIFAVDVYEEVAEAYLRGLERRAARNQDIARIASVASFFLSRIDTAVDRELESISSQRSGAASLYGKAAIASAKIAYRSFQRIFGGHRFAEMARRGAQVQRPLWASTSTKNPRYRDTLYVDSLIGPDTVNTVPPHTFEAFRDHGRAAPTLEQDGDQAPGVFQELAALGVDLKRITDELTREGVAKFADSFRRLMQVIEARRDQAIFCLGERHTVSLGGYSGDFQTALANLAAQQVTQRIWKKDPSVWTYAPDHQPIIRNSLGWVTVAESTLEMAADLKAFAGEIRREGYEYAVVLGMGGSSLCPAVLSHTFRSADWPELLVLDSTVPAAVRQLDSQIDPRRTMFIVASKSGTTTEPQMFCRYYQEKVRQALGDDAGKNFIAITDPGTPLELQARRDGFRRIFLNQADIGGRYSALSHFGMVPFALMGGDVEALLHRALRAQHACAATIQAVQNPGARLGTALGTLALSGRNKLTLITPPPIDSLGLWIEQLIAESTGKERRGIVPIAGEPLGEPGVYGDDRVFAYLRVSAQSQPEIEKRLDELEAAGHPVLRHTLHDSLDLGEEFYLWEFATAVAAAILGIDAFDQPNVQESKDNTARLLAQYAKTGSLDAHPPVASERGLSLFTDEENGAAISGAGGEFDRCVAAHLGRIRAHDYVAITQFIEETPAHNERLEQLRVAVRDATGAAVTTGYGPRFLHSTGQLHKGGPDNGLFIQLTAPDREDLGIPGMPATFGVLKQAQALGDFESLSRHHRRAIRIDLGSDVAKGLSRLVELARGFARREPAKSPRVA